MTTSPASTTTIHRAPRFMSGTAVTIAAGLALAIGLQVSDNLGTQDSQTQLASRGEQVDPTADSGVADPAADALLVLSDPSPAVSAHIGNAATTENPFEMMTDLTPVISDHLYPHSVSVDPFQDMRDLTPTVSALKASDSE